MYTRTINEKSIEVDSIPQKNNGFTIVIKLPNSTFTVPIKISTHQEEWNIAIPPELYVTKNKRLALANGHIVVDFTYKVWYYQTRPWQKHDLDNVSFDAILCHRVSQGEEFKEIVSGILPDLSMASFVKNMEKLPSSLDASKWRVLPTTEALLQSEIWKHIPQVMFKGIGHMTVKSFAYIIKQFMLQNREYVSSDFRREMTKRKVILPIHVAKFQNSPWVATATPQSADAGLIVEEPIGIKRDKCGRILHVPKDKVSITGAQCPFPGFMKPSREVVLRAISQAMQLEKPEKPMVVSKYHDVPKIDTVNLFAARMWYHGLTDEDGYVISQSASNRMVSFQENIETIKLPKNATINLQAICFNTDILCEYDTLIKTSLPFVNNGIIATIMGENNNTIVRTKNHGLVTKLQVHEHENWNFVSVSTLTKFNLSIGSKIMDRNSHKGTIAKILPDWEMPKAWDEITKSYRKLDIICPPAIGKRGTPSREMEEISAIAARQAQKTLCVYDSNLEQLRKFNSGKSRMIFQAHGFSKFPVLSWDVPCSYVAFAVLDHIPAKKLRFSDTLNTNFADRTLQGRKNYNFTDGLFALIQYNADNLVAEIQSYAHSAATNNMSILNKNMETLGFQITRDKITITENGILKSRPDEENPVIETGVKKTDPDPDITGTIFDPKFNKRDIWIRIPQGVQVAINEIVAAMGSQSISPNHIQSWLNSDKAKTKMKTWNIPINHIFHDGTKEAFVKIPGSEIYTYTSPTGECYPNNIMTRINNFILTANNLAKIKEKWTFGLDTVAAQEVRVNMMFNHLIESIIESTIRKNGILREVLSPRTPFSGFSQAASSGGGKPHEIFIPISAIMCYYYRNEDFRKAYKIPEGLSPSQVVKYFNKYQYRVLIMRQPCHTRQEINSYICRVWHEKAIGIHNNAITMHRGDLDGDLLFWYFPISEKAQQDLKLITIEETLVNSESTKGLEYLDPAKLQDNPVNAISEANIAITGECENLANQNTYLDFAKKREDYQSQQEIAALEFNFIKSGTANAGGIGNCVRHIMSHKWGRKGIEYGNEIYHSLAQAALDCKHMSNNSNQIEELLTMLRSTKDPGKGRIENALAKFIPNISRDKLMEILYLNGQWSSGISNIAANLVPFSRLLYRGNLSFMYRATITEEHSVAKWLAAGFDVGYKPEESAQ